MRMGLGLIVGASLLASFGARAQAPCPSQPMDAAAALSATLRDLHYVPHVPPDDLSARGQDVYMKFIESLEPEDVTWNDDGTWYVTNRSKIIDLLLDMPMKDWSEPLDDKVRDLMGSIDLDDDASLGDVPGAVGDHIEDRIEDRLGKRNTDILRLGLGVAYASQYGGKARLFSRSWNDSRLRLYYTYDPDGPDGPGLKYSYTPSSRTKLDLDLQPDKYGINFRRELDTRYPSHISLSAGSNNGEEYVMFRFHMSLPFR